MTARRESSHGTAGIRVIESHPTRRLDSPVRSAPAPEPTGEQDSTRDLTIVIVSFNDGPWLEPCLRSVYAHSAGVDLDVVVVDNGDDGARELVDARFPTARVLRTSNKGFANANNVALAEIHSRYVLLLNPDTEVIGGELADLVASLDARPEVGLAGVVQVDSQGELLPTIRYFPTVRRVLGDAFAAERWRARPRWLGERELDPHRYERETLCDWTSGSFMVIRREALLSAGLLDDASSSTRKKRTSAGESGTPAGTCGIFPH